MNRAEDVLFHCSYCLSSIDKCLRFREIELVKKELTVFYRQESTSGEICGSDV